MDAPPAPPAYAPSSDASASASTPSRPASRSAAPAAGGPPEQYERAFRQWSSPGFSIPEEPMGPPGQVSFQVYTAQDIGSGRRPMRSMPLIAVEKKPRVLLWVGLALLGVVIVVVTAAAVIAVSMEEPKRATQPGEEAPLPASVEPTAEPTAPPATITIGDPVDDEHLEAEPEPGVSPVVAKPKPKVTPSDEEPSPGTAKPKPKGAPGAAPGAAPTPAKSVAPPPNPYLD